MFQCKRHKYYKFQKYEYEIVAHYNVNVIKNPDKKNNFSINDIS